MWQQISIDVSLVAWLLLELCCHLRFDESIGDDDHAAFAKQMFKLQCKFLPTPGIWIIFQRTFAQRSMRPPDQIGRTIEFGIHSVEIDGVKNMNVFCQQLGSSTYDILSSMSCIIS